MTRFVVLQMHTINFQTSFKRDLLVQVTAVWSHRTSYQCFRKTNLIPHEQTFAFWFLSSPYANIQQQPEYTHKHTHIHTQQYTWLVLSPAFLSVFPLSFPDLILSHRLMSSTILRGARPVTAVAGAFSVLTSVLQTCLLLTPLPETKPHDHDQAVKTACRSNPATTRWVEVSSRQSEAYWPIFIQTHPPTSTRTSPNDLYMCICYTT